MHALIQWALDRYAEGDFAWWVLLTLELLALATIPSVLVQRRGRPSAALAWLLALSALPGISLVAWWLLGRSHLSYNSRRRRAAQSARKARHAIPVFPRDEDAVELFRGTLAESWLTEDLRCLAPPTTGNNIELLVDGGEMFPAMEEALRGAKRTVETVFYTWENDATGTRFRDILIDLAKRGVEVRVLVDAFGSGHFRRRFVRPMKQAGVKTALFLPLRLRLSRPTFNFRNHRKILVIDNEVAFTGGMNIAEEYEWQWHDMGVRVRGPAVAQLRDIVLDDWYFATGELVTSELSPAVEGKDACAVMGCGPDETANVIHDSLFLAMTGAKRRLWLTTPYFIPSPQLVTAMRTAAMRGVDVRILLPAKADVPFVIPASRSYFPGLLKSHVRVYLYQPRMVHAKTLLVDDDIAYIGSANVDTRSFRLQFESICLVRSPDLCRRLGAIFQRDLQQSVEVREDDLEGAWLANLQSSFAHLLSPLM